MKFHLTLAFHFLSWGKKYVCDTGDEAVMWMHKKIKIGIPITCKFCTVPFTVYSEFEAKTLGLSSWQKYGLSFGIKMYTTSGWALGDGAAMGILL